ncbi:hypothetical protein [Henriciella marina]|uniref:hypothetical protein n=1 Tax=Henriciella marina TaxID=453851 RepID=UPI00037C2F4D|nr:hypothetical protein [Henriciella marina]
MTESRSFLKPNGPCLALAVLCGVSFLASCDRQAERIDRLEDIAEGVSEQVNDLEKVDDQESAEDGRN